MATYQVNRISTADLFTDLQQPWNDLVERSIRPQPFLLWEWVYTWWEVYQKNSYELYILTVTRDDKLVALAPFYVDNSHWLVKGRLRVLGEGEAFEDEVVSHYPDVICLEDNRIGAADAIGKYLLEHDHEWRLGQFRFMLGDSVLNDIHQSLTKRFDHYTVTSSNQYAIDLPESPENYLQGLSKSMRKQFRSRLSRMEKSGEIEIRSAQQFDDPHEALEILERLHRARWQDELPNIIFDSGPFKSFHQRLLNRMLHKGIIDIRVMYHNGEPIAAVHNFNFQRRCFSYQSGFKSQDDKRFSPMVVFDILEIQALISAGYLQYDYLSAEGDQSYKKRFLCGTTPVYETLWLKRGWQSKVMRGYRQCRAFAASHYHRLRALLEQGLPAALTRAARKNPEKVSA